MAHSTTTPRHISEKKKLLNVRVNARAQQEDQDQEGNNKFANTVSILMLIVHVKLLPHQLI